MIRSTLVAAFALIALVAPIIPASGETASDAPASAAPDYSLAANWVCRPGSEAICETGLDATVVEPGGKRKREAFVPAADPRIDCFYVYPTVSREPTPYADLQDSPEIQRTVKAQAGRLSSRCRVFAPIYRQATLAHLFHLTGDMTADGISYAKQDVAAAWNYYLAHDNHGRGVVLIGHSQGTILLQDLIASQIDGSDAQKVLVSAFLAGDPSLAVPPGKTVGGTFAHIPVCSSAGEVACVYAWGSYLESETTPRRKFGRPRRDGMQSACVNPAAPAGGSGVLKFYYSASDAAAAGAPWVESAGTLSGACRSDDDGDSFFITTAGGAPPDVDDALQHSDIGRGWGVHPLDLNLVQGNILDVLDAETATWTRTHDAHRR